MAVTCDNPVKARLIFPGFEFWLEPRVLGYGSAQLFAHGDRSNSAHR